ncbi:MAG: hypothetical protein BWY26_01680 [Elusimicrobia bacterium ADurb.Bin231]|nr:MAG: hypothetical protein BWY26_01680 [Elusimicrobia bacterium ADurb.Bin231]
MKGITHFVSGLAVATFFPKAVCMASRGGIVEGAESSFILVLGALYGIMPDTLDFKFGQFFSLPDYDIDCDPIHPDPQKMAESMGKAMEEAFEKDKLVKVQLYPMQLGSDLWRQYVIKFDGENNEVVIILNEIVSTSQVPFEGTAPKENRVGRYKLKSGKMLETHGRPSAVDIMSGPQFGFQKFGEHVLVEFLPWHRTWSHSYVLGFFLSLPVFAITYFFNLTNWYLYGLIAFLGFATHITEDLSGHMGGSLLWPFIKKRYNGFCLARASDPRLNFSVIYLSVTIILFNIDRFTVNVIPLPWYKYYFFFFVIPIILFLIFAEIFGVKTQIKEGLIGVDEILKQARVSNAAAIDELNSEEESIIE